MVRKSVILVMVALLAVTMAMPLTAAAASYSAYDGNISTTYVTFFRDISSKIPINSDYVFFRSSQYDYTMIVGDLDFSGDTFTSSVEVQVYEISTNSGSSYNSTYSYSVSSENNFSLSAGSSLLYSNLGNYPDLIERNDYYAFSAVLLLLIGICLYLCRSVFGFCLRLRS